MASLTSEPERRSSTFLNDTQVDANDQSEWAAMSSNHTIKFNDSLPSEEELSNITSLKEELGTLLTEGALSQQPENVSDFKLLRFLRGYENSVEEAATAYREMAKYRDENDFNRLRQKLVDGNKEDPNLWSEYKPIRDILSKGMRYEYGFDLAQNVVTVTDIGALDLRSIIKAGLQDLYCEMCLMTEEYSNVRLHDLTVERGHLVARHDIINVSNFGVFQWNKACYDLITKVFAGNKHYPECVVKITSCGNGSVAVMAWKVMKHFVPERTKQKLAVLGTSFISDLVLEVPFQRIPLIWGGGGVTRNGFDYAWSEECTKESLCVGRRDVSTLKIGIDQPGRVVEWSWKLAGYSIKVCSQFARLESGGESGGGSGSGETKEGGDAMGGEKEMTSLSFAVVEEEKTCEASGGVVTGRFVAPCKGVFQLTFDNTFSMLRSKTVEISIRVVEESGSEEDEDDEDMKMRMSKNEVKEHIS